MMKINLIKQASKGISKKEIAIYQQLIIGVAAVVVLIGILVFLEYSIENAISTTTTKITSLNEEMLRLNKTVNQINDFKKKKEQIKAKLDIIKTLEKNRIAQVVLMDELSKSIPIDQTSIISKRLWLTSLSEQGNLVLMEGIALDNDTIAKFMKDLSRNGYFREIKLQQTSQFTSNDLLLYKFGITCKYVFSEKH
ncbi:MAG: PilN domain-containing protein [Deltaproteobacteria bacterium]|nr:PilN domain-containing protein [Deltaproteobacteria bacterium]MCL5792820.1 PilN domain-containing protein [Deltaproteobacteria bacterium]